jgi:hypothetical protein
MRKANKPIQALFNRYLLWYMSLEYCLIFILHLVMVAFSRKMTLYTLPSSCIKSLYNHNNINTSTLYCCGYCYCNICLLCSNESTSLWTKEANCPGSAPFNTRILKAHSHSVSGGSIWACLECQCYFWTAGGLVSPRTQWLLTFPISKQHWHSREAQIEPPLIECEWAFRIRA